MIIGSTKVTYSQINTLLGPTFPPKVIGNIVLLSYEGVSFAFNFNQDLSQKEDLFNFIFTSDNYLAKINILGEDKHYN